MCHLSRYRRILETIATDCPETAESTAKFKNDALSGLCKTRANTRIAIAFSSMKGIGRRAPGAGVSFISRAGKSRQRPERPGRGKSQDAKSR
jgi:hypothetical protein